MQTEHCIIKTLRDIKALVQEQKFKLPADNYKIIVGDGTYTSWSNEIEINEYDTKVINLKLNNEFKLMVKQYIQLMKKPQILVFQLN